MTEIGDGEDKISELPLHIIHDILRRIRQNRFKEEARTCVLSQTWNSIWRSRPDVIINQYSHESFVNNLENFVKFVDDSLRPYARQNLRIETLRLQCLDHPGLASHIDRWLNLAIKHNVTSLEISAMDLDYYSIPDALYAAKTLTELSLCGCNFGIDHSSTNKLQRLISTCQFIRDLKIGCCTGIQNLCVSGLVNLEKLELKSCQGLVKVEIRAPNLQKFVYVGVPLEKYPKTREPESLPCTIDILDGYNTLKFLHLEATTMTDQQFEYQFSKFPALEVLELTGCYVMKNIKVVSAKLKRFSLWDWGNLEQVNMLAPNLKEFDFESGKMCMPFSTIDPSNLERANINFYLPASTMDPDFSRYLNCGDVDTSWYNNLQDLVQKFNYLKGLVLVILCEKYKSILIYEDPSEILVPPTEELELCINNPSMHLEKFAYDLIKTGPKIISIVPRTESKMIQVFHEAITGYKKKQNRRSLNEVIDHKGAVGDGVGTSPLYSWLKSTPLIERITTFMFKWEE